MEFYRTRVALTLLGTLIALIVFLPNVVNMENIWWFSKAKINYGLDIQGGLHLVMGVDVDGVVTEQTNRMVVSLTEELRQAGISAQVSTDAPAQGKLIISGLTGDAGAKVRQLIAEKHATVLQETETVGDGGLVFRYFESYMTDYKTRVIQQSIETIRNRIDEFGVAEPSIQQQGGNRILVQLPGMADAERAKELINTTAKLDFMIVSTAMTQDQLVQLITDAEKAGSYNLDTTKYSEYVTRLNKDLEGKIPPQTVVYFERSANAQTIESGALPYLLKTDTNLTGGALDDAFVSYDQYGAPEVALRFNSAGGAKFADLTGANVGQRMAVVLDRVVKTAPNLRERIAGGQAVISLGSGNRDQSLKEAKMISMALRAGALPAALEQLEERRVGPTLGSDSVAAAKVASFIGSALIVALIIFWYKGMGAVASLALGVNILCMFAILTTLGATLTLPGIAGIALTVGFAVDANVLINERIRDELRAGSSMQGAIRYGYDRAMSAILDSNIMTAATAIVLLYFGTGPVKGFAVTLLIGIVTTLFANVFVSKVIADTLVNKFNIKKISV